MAVLDSLPGIEATICINKVPLQEYEDDEVEITSGHVGEYQAARTVSKYVESATDEEFSIKLSVDHPYKPDCPSLGFIIYIDGVSVAYPLAVFAASGSGWPPHRHIEGVKTTETGRVMMEPFKFSRIETTLDEDKLADVKHDAKRISKLGGITVMVYRQSERKMEKSTPKNIKLVHGPEAVVHEKALKGQAKSHGATFGQSRPTRAYSSCTAEMLDGRDYPIAIFKFKYRSNEALKQLLIIKRAPEPECAPVPDKKIKRERQNNNQSESSRKKPKVEEIEIVDLTVESDEENIGPLN